MGAGVSTEQAQVAEGQRLMPSRMQTPKSSYTISRTASPMPFSEKSTKWQHVKTARLALGGLAKHTSTNDPIISISRKGFSSINVSITQGQVVTFIWNDQTGTGFNVTQVVHDGDQFRPVIGGFCSGQVKRVGRFEQQFNLVGDYKFVSAGVRSTPITITVLPRMPIEVQVTDDGFSPKIIRVEQGTTVKWEWSLCNITHSVAEVQYCARHGAFASMQPKKKTISTPSGQYRHEFKHVGMYYFQTEGSGVDEMHLCIIQVKEAQWDHRIEILDRTFSPMVVLIEEGDRVWWHWDSMKCKKTHAPYQIEPPSMNYRPSDAYKQVKGGFKWPNASKCGLMSYEFYEPGVYYFSDQNLQEAAEYIGTVIVRPKQKEHFIHMTVDGFKPEIINAETGDRIWWIWNMAELVQPFKIMESEKCLSSLGRSSLEPDCADQCRSLTSDDEHQCSHVGFGTVLVNSVGVYHYRAILSGETVGIQAVIVDPGVRNYTIHVTDSGFEPKVITIHPNDMVWWVWQMGTKQHNIIQVSHQGTFIKNGFCSGMARDCPSAYSYQFKSGGVFYYISNSLPNMFGAIVVAKQSQVHEVEVTSKQISPDPIIITANDVVCWTFSNLQTCDLTEVDTVDEILDAHFTSRSIESRKVLSRSFDKTGVHHFFSKSFGKKNRSGDNNQNTVSSVLVDDGCDSACVRVDGLGFHPREINIVKGQSVLWTWKECGDQEAHNIIHVNPPDSENPLCVIDGQKSFSSGRTTPKNSFLYTFEDVGVVCVASQGAPGYAGVINVLPDASRVEMPYIISDVTQGTVERYHVVELYCYTKEATIYYTTDGTSPLPHQIGSKKYDSAKGIVMKESGMRFVRAVAFADDMIPSNIYTSKRFWVLSKDDSDETDTDSQASIEAPGEGNSEWFNCCPTIRGCFTGPGMMEVFWESMDHESMDLVKGCQIFLNSVSYCPMFPPNHNSLNLSGLAGGRNYEIYLEIYAKDPMFLPHKTNFLMMKCPKACATGGPLISLEVTDRPDSLTIVWCSVSSDKNPVKFYSVYLNGQQCGDHVIPNKDSNRCRVTIDGCTLQMVYKVIVMAVMEDDSRPKTSNELEVSLPLEKENIVPPEPNNRLPDGDLYKEFIEIREGSEYLSGFEGMVTEQVVSASSLGSQVPGPQPAPEDDRQVKPSTELTPITEGTTPEPSIDNRSREELLDDLGTGKENTHTKSYVTEKQNMEVIVSDDSTAEEPKPNTKTKRKKKRKEQEKPNDTSVVDCHEMPDLSATSEEEEDEDPDRERPSIIAAASAAAMMVSAPVLANHEPKDQYEFDGIIPAPVISIQRLPGGNDCVDWHLAEQPSEEYSIIVYIVNIIGKQFEKDVNSDISFDSIYDNEPLIQHSWNVTSGLSCEVAGLLPGITYKVYVIAQYTLNNGTEEPCDIKASSAPLQYTTLGSPSPPTLTITSVDLHQAVCEWTPGSSHPDAPIAGYKVFLDTKKMGADLSATTMKTTIDKIPAGKTVKAFVIATTKHAEAGNSKPSNTVRITCPCKPVAPTITQHPSFTACSAILAWDAPPKDPTKQKCEDITWYSIYVDEKYHGEVQSNSAANKNGYQYQLTDLLPGNIYDANIRAFSGTKRIIQNSSHAVCVCESDLSNVLPIQTAAPPKSPHIRIEGLTPEGIDITWQTPQQYADAAISGYQVYRNGKPYGSTVPPDVHTMRIRDITLGEKITLQMRALTEHSVGFLSSKTKTDSAKDEGNLQGDKYTACKLGPSLTVHYTGLVMAPDKVWCEHVTGHSALIVWTKGGSTKTHFVMPDEYQVTWWPGTKPEEGINSVSTPDDQVVISNLYPNTLYTVIVEARRTEGYHGIAEDTESVIDSAQNNSFILTSKSGHLAFQTARPPDPPSNLSVMSSTCHSMRLRWDPPREHGVDIIGLRVDLAPLKTNNSTFENHVSKNLMPDATDAIVEHLSEFTKYLVTVTTITSEYFDQLPDKHPLKKRQILPEDVSFIPKDNPWLPQTSMIALTSGTIPPTCVTVKTIQMSTLTIDWKPPIVHGSNQLAGIIVRWSESHSSKHNSGIDDLACHTNLGSQSRRVVLDDLKPGTEYKVVVEAVVSVKNVIGDDYSDVNRRMTHVMSKPIIARTSAPVEAPRIYITGFSSSTVHLYWEKPLLYSVIGQGSSDQPVFLKRSLQGYKILINGKLHVRLGTASQTCTLTRCKPGKKYNIELVALTCAEKIRKDRRKRKSEVDFTPEIQDQDLDESPSNPVEVVTPFEHDGSLSNVIAKIEDDSVVLKWDVYGNWSAVKQFDVSWFSHNDRVLHKKVIANDIRRSTIPAVKEKTVYDISLRPQYETKSYLNETTQHLEILTPGRPDPPDIFVHSVDNEEFVVEWGEPRLYGGVKIKGYQVYLNDKKIGQLLNAAHRKAVIPCRPNRHYRVNLVALSADPCFDDSTISNTLLISTTNSSIDHPFMDGPVDDDDIEEENVEHDLVLRLSKVTDTTIQLSWCSYIEDGIVHHYKLQWNSVVQPNNNEIRLKSSETSCILQRCCPGTNHSVQLLAMAEDGEKIIEKSRQLIVETSAPPDTPVVGLRACNFKYLAVQWEKPKTYGAALITGFKVYVNGVVEGILSADQHNFSYTQGKQCCEYSFQVQALSTVDKLCSSPSDPLLIIWPGLKTPTLLHLPTVSSNCIKLAWEQPYTTPGVKIKQYRVVCRDQETDRVVQTISPIHPDTKVVELQNLKAGLYSVGLEIQIHGSDQVFHTDPLEVKPTISPDPPHITVTVVGLEERRHIERITCDLINKRDRLLNLVMTTSGDQKETNKSKAVEYIKQLEFMLKDCFAKLNQYSGHIQAHVSWLCPQTNADLAVSGYKVLVDGKHYGSTLHAGVNNVRLKLDLGVPCHRVSMVSVSDQPIATSMESNVLELLTEPFFPFSFYCFHTLHQRDAQWPNHGACQFEDSLAAEQRLPPRKYNINPGSFVNQLPVPRCSALDVFTGHYKPFLTPGGSNRPTVMLFWTTWCMASVKTMTYYVQFAKRNFNDYDFVAVACGTDLTNPAERQKLAHMLSSNNWRNDEAIWHCTSHCTSLDKDGQQSSGNSSDMCDHFGIVGVPTMVVVNANGNVAWQGRYCALDYVMFECFMLHVFNTVVHSMCPVQSCTLCEADISLDVDAIEIAKKGILSMNTVVQATHSVPSLSNTGNQNQLLIASTFVPKNSPAENIRNGRRRKSSRGKIPLAFKSVGSNKLFMKTHNTDNTLNAYSVRPLSAVSSGKGKVKDGERPKSAHISSAWNN